MHKTSFAAALLFAQIVASAAAAGDDPFRYHKAGLTTDIWRVSNTTFASWITDFNNQSKDTSTLEPGSSVIVFRANLNRGSDAPACNMPKYELKTISADQLFNGRLNNPTQDAKEIGLDQRDIVMLDAGCGTNVYSGLRKIGKQCRRRRPHFPRLV